MRERLKEGVLDSGCDSLIVILVKPLWQQCSYLTALCCWLNWKPSFAYSCRYNTVQRWNIGPYAIVYFKQGTIMHLINMHPRWIININVFLRRPVTWMCDAALSPNAINSSGIQLDEHVLYLSDNALIKGTLRDNCFRKIRVYHVKVTVKRQWASLASLLWRIPQNIWAVYSYKRVLQIKSLAFDWIAKQWRAGFRVPHDTRQPLPKFKKYILRRTHWNPFDVK